MVLRSPSLNLRYYLFDREKDLITMISLVLLTGQAPSKLADELLSSGYQVYEALAISEVLFHGRGHDGDRLDSKRTRVLRELWSLNLSSDGSGRCLFLPLGPALLHGLTDTFTRCCRQSPLPAPAIRLT